MKAKKAALKEAVPETKEDREETKDVVQIDEVQREIAEGFGEYRRRLLNARVDSGIFPRSSLKLDR